MQICRDRTSYIEEAVYVRHLMKEGLSKCFQSKAGLAGEMGKAVNSLISYDNLFGAGKFLSIPSTT